MLFNHQIIINYFFTSHVFLLHLIFDNTNTEINYFNMNTSLFKSILSLLLIIIFVHLHSDVFAQKTKKKKGSDGKESSITDSKEATSESEYYFVEGMKYYVIDDYSKALENFNRALVLSNGAPSISYKIAETYFQMNNYDQAEFHAEEALEKDKSNKYFFILLAKIQEKKQKFDEAIKTYQNMIDSKIASDEYYYEIAELAIKQKNYNKALDAFNQLEKKYGINESITSQKQRLYIQLNQIEKAIAEGEKLIQTSPDEPRYVVILAELLLSSGKTQQALPLLEKIAQSNSLDPRVALLLAQIYKKEGDNAKANAQLKSAFANPELDANEKINLMIGFMQNSEDSAQEGDFLELAENIVKVHPNSAKAFALYADLLILKNDKAQALENYLKSARLDPSKADVWQRILALDADAQKSDSLIRHADQALEYFPNQGLFWMYSGMGYLTKKDYSKAINAFEEGKRLAFSNKDLLEDFYLRLGDAYNGLKQYAESDAAYESVLKTNPNNPSALNNYSYYLALRKEKLDLAKQLAERLVGNHPENATYLDTFGWVLYTSKDYKKARKYLEKAAQTSTNGTILEHFGDVLFKLGESDKALEQWSKAKKVGGASVLIDKKIANKSLYE